jgi:hypothetical protein
MQAHEYDGAIADLTRAIQLKPDERAYYADRGDLRSLVGDGVGAAEDREKEGSFTPEMTRSYELMLQEVSELRRLPILCPVPVLYRSSQAALLQALELDQDSGDFHGEDLTYQRLGIAPKGFSIRDWLIRDSSGVGYDTAMQAVFFDISSRSILAHELSHALQDQNFSNAFMESARRHNSDAQLVFETLEESDARLFDGYWEAFYPESGFFHYAAPEGRDDPTRGQIGPLLPEPPAPKRVAAELDTFLRHLTLESWIKTAIDSSASPRAAEAFADLSIASPTVGLPLDYPSYVHEIGQPFIKELLKRGGWERVNAAYRDMPSSSSQILHPEKYFAGEEPVEIKLPDISKRLGQDWKWVRSDTLGEYSYGQILQLTLPESKEKAVTAAGWRGDRYSIYEGPQPGDVCMIQVSVWATEQEAQTFFEQYERHILHRYPSAKEIPASTDAHVWTTNEGGAFLERKGRAVLIAEGVPESARKR